MIASAIEVVAEVATDTTITAVKSSVETDIFVGDFKANIRLFFEVLDIDTCLSAVPGISFKLPNYYPGVSSTND